MTLFDKTRNLFNDAVEFIPTKNYYFETHVCDGEKKRVNLDIKITRDDSKDCVVLGICEKCKKVFYMDTFEIRSF